MVEFCTVEAILEKKNDCTIQGIPVYSLVDLYNSLLAYYLMPKIR